MKKFLAGLGIAILLLGKLSLPAHALFNQTWISSNTATADTTQNLCKKSTRAAFHGVRINNGATGTLTIYNSSGTATNPIAVVQTSSTWAGDYDVITSSGLTYSNSATANVTILYQCY